MKLAGVCIRGGNEESPIVLDKIESDLHSKGLLRKIWSRYIDDISTIVHEDKIDEMLEVLNKVQGNLKFTIEIEDNGELPFLDLRILREGKGISFKIYRKLIHTQRTIPENWKCSYSH